VIANLGRVVPRGSYAGGPVRRVLVLQLGDNPTTDYYLSPRLEASGLAWTTADLRDAPDLGDPAGLWVIVVRYGASRWIRALRGARGLAGVSLMLDDDIRAMLFDGSLPWSYRSHVAAWHGRHAMGLSVVVSEIWASTAVLAERCGGAAVIDPLPEADPPAPSAAAPPLAVYHGGASHAAERRFVIAVARLSPEVRFEVVGAPEAAPDNVDFVPETGWPAYRATQAGRSAAVALAPLFPSAVNAARAPVKAFDAARLGAAGLYADAPAYRGFVRDVVDGRLLPMRPEAWAEAIADLVAHPAMRLALAEAARARLIDLRRAPSPLPGVGR
jgi:glycosyltransferase involved in cell wall biosynthesis